MVVFKKYFEYKIKIMRVVDCHNKNLRDSIYKILDNCHFCKCIAMFYSLNIVPSKH
jgi:hypothetical protein